MQIVLVPTNTIDSQYLTTYLDDAGDIVVEHPYQRLVVSIRKRDEISLLD
jgi:hypothetical protein